MEIRMGQLKNHLKLEGITQEKRMVTSFNIKGKECTFSGEPDLEDKNLNKIFMDTNKSRIIDYKSQLTGGYKSRYKKKDGYTKQLNSYNMLSAIVNNYIYESLWDCWIMPDWRMYNTKKLNYPYAPIIMEEMPLMDVAKVEAAIIAKITKIESLMTDKIDEWKKLPYCSKKNRWQDPPLYKVYKLNKNGDQPKTIKAVAHGNCETMEQAIMLKASKKEPKEYDIKFYPSEPVRCKGWCELGSCGLCDAMKQWKDGNL